MTTLGTFAVELGSEPWAYITNCRLEAAKELLRYRDVEIWRIAHFTGCAGLQPFWRAFKVHTGLAPSE